MHGSKWPINSTRIVVLDLVEILPSIYGGDQQAGKQQLQAVKAPLLLLSAGTCVVRLWLKHTHSTRNTVLLFE